MRSAVAGRWWRARADAVRVVGRRGSARVARRAFGRRRRPLDHWLAVTAGRHEAYRRQVQIPEGSLAAVCVSRRPARFDDVVAAVARQVDVPLRFVFVGNHADFDVDWCRATAVAAGLDDAVVIEAPAGSSLGAGLNLALDATSARYVAKFDDDDRYGAQHLADSLRALGYSGAGVVGKHSYYAEFETTGRRVLRFPGREFASSSTLAGGTLVLDRERVGDQRFEEISLGEDRAFIAACVRRGVSTFAADRFNFVQMRGGDNTWQVPEDHFTRRTLDVDPGHPHHVVDR